MKKTKILIFLFCLAGMRGHTQISYVISGNSASVVDSPNATGNIGNRLKTATLPKITAQHSTDLQAALDDYKKTKVTQVVGKGDAIKLRNDLATMVESVALRRRQLQHAADGEFPHTDPANAGMRKKFDLPANRPLNA